MSMKKVASIASHNSVFFVSVLALSSLALAQHTIQPAAKKIKTNSFRLFARLRNSTSTSTMPSLAGYGPFLGCVSGSDHGAMGIHYVNPSLLNGTINATQPQALIYEPSSNGQMTLVGVEYIADAATWLANNSGPPILEGQVFLFVDSPNRFHIPSFFELHVWAWRDNPQGSFVDWNDHVSCAHE